MISATSDIINGFASPDNARSGIAPGRTQIVHRQYRAVQRRINIVELFDLAKALKFDPHEIVRRLAATKPD
jgi:hypothetical protein